MNESIFLSFLSSLPPPPHPPAFHSLLAASGDWVPNPIEKYPITLWNMEGWKGTKRGRENEREGRMENGREEIQVPGIVIFFFFESEALTEAPVKYLKFSHVR